MRLEYQTIKVMWFWLYGPFPCGAWPDLKIFESRMIGLLRDNENVVADCGYQNNHCFTPTSMAGRQRTFQAHIRARHKSCNTRFKNFWLLQQVLRHDVTLHGMVSHAMEKLTALMIRSDDQLFQLQSVNSLQSEMCFLSLKQMSSFKSKDTELYLLRIE